MVTFFEQAGVNKENEKAADRRSGQCPRNSEQLHPGVGRFVADRDSRAAGIDTLHLSSQTRADSYSVGHVIQHSWKTKENPQLIVQFGC